MKTNLTNAIRDLALDFAPAHCYEPPFKFTGSIDQVIFRLNLEVRP